MKKEKAEPFIVFMGRYSTRSILTGPEKTAKRIFDIHSLNNSAAFVQYFFDGSKFGLIKKLFGKETEQDNNGSTVYTIGLFRVLYLLVKLKPDIIHIITYERFAVFALFYKFFSRVKIVYNEHGIIAYEDSMIKSVSYIYRLKDKFCEWMYLKYSDIIIFFSERSLDMARGFFKINESKVLIFSNGIDEDFHLIAAKRNSGNILKAVVLNSSEYQLSGINFLKKILKKCETPLELYIISNKIDTGLDEKNISLFCVNKMETTALADFYKDKDIFFSLNNYDTFSIASVEAMAAGLIPIVTNETGMSRFILNGENGYCLPYNDTEGAAQYLNELSINTELRNNLSLKASEIYDILSWNDVYESYKNLYERLSR